MTRWMLFWRRDRRPGRMTQRGLAAAVRLGWRP